MGKENLETMALFLILIPIYIFAMSAQHFITGWLADVVFIFGLVSIVGGFLYAAFK